MKFQIYVSAISQRMFWRELDSFNEKQIKVHIYVLYTRNSKFTAQLELLTNQLNYLLSTIKKKKQFRNHFGQP